MLFGQKNIVFNVLQTSLNNQTLLMRFLSLFSNEVQSYDMMEESKNRIAKHAKTMKYPIPVRSFSMTDMMLLITLFFFGFFSRTFRIQYPSARVFDEVHFGKFMNGYIKKLYFFDIHPPLGKLLLALFGWLGSYQANIDFDNSTDGYSDLFYHLFRMVPASLASCMPPLSFLAFRCFGFSKVTSLFVGVYLLIESMLIVESRLILIDGILHFFVVLSVLCVSLMNADAFPKAAIVATGIAAGCTFSVKFTGLSIIVFIGAYQFFQVTKGQYLKLFKDKDFFKSSFINVLARFLIVLIISIAILFINFAIHIEIFEYPYKHGKSSPNYCPQIRAVNKWKDVGLIKSILNLIKEMHRQNQNLINVPHSASSRWHQWPFHKFKAIAYYANHQQTLILHPNPFSWTVAAYGPILCVIVFLVALIFNNICILQILIWPAGYYASFLPFALIKRTTFVYHYLIPLIFGIMSFAVSIEVIFSQYKRTRACIMIILIVSGLASWVFFAPWCYSMTGYSWYSRRWYSGML